MLFCDLLVFVIFIANRQQSVVYMREIRYNQIESINIRFGLALVVYIDLHV